MKFYFFHMKPDETKTTLKHSKSFHGIVKNLSKRMKMKDKGEFNITMREHLGSI